MGRLYTVGLGQLICLLKGLTRQGVGMFSTLLGELIIQMTLISTRTYQMLNMLVLILMIYFQMALRIQGLVLTKMLTVALTST